MILVDDAGWGSLVGGCIIGALRSETGKPGNFTYEVIPVEQFQGEAFSHEEYFKGAGDATLRCFQTLGVRQDEEILVCTGHVLNGACAWLGENNFRYARGKITGELQDRIEHALQDYLGSLGFTVAYDVLTELDKKGLFWWQSVQFLKGNVHRKGCIEHRMKLCKTGWSTFEAWAMLPYAEAKIEATAIRNAKKAARRSAYYGD